VGILTDGSRLYVTERTGNASFLVQGSVTGGDTLAIPTPFVETTAFDISGDHLRLLVSDRVATQKEAQAWVLPLPTGNPHRLSNIVAHEAVWSPDRRQLAFAKGADIFLANEDGTNPRRLITVSGSADWIRFSLDGSHLRFTLNTPDTNSTSIWEVRADGSDLHALLPGWRNPHSECCGVWSADGRYYFFVSAGSARSDIWALAETGGVFHKTPSTPLQLTNGPMALGLPVPSPDGKKLFAEGYLPRGELVFYDRTSHHFLPFLSGISADEAAFSRDGKWVAYVSFPDRTLWRSRIDGSERPQLTFPPVLPFLPFWSPDGKQISYTNKQAGQPTKIFPISTQGGTPEEMFSEKEYQWDANWSPDGRKIIFGRPPFIAERYSEKIALQLLILILKRFLRSPARTTCLLPVGLLTASTWPLFPLI
jgi:Tol biopolymer transport system component